jgi:hypothetical protein
MSLYRCRETGKRINTRGVYLSVEYRRVAHEGVTEEPLEGGGYSKL